MTPIQYADEIVVPAVRDALEQRADRRRAYVACIVTHHLGDYLARVHRAPGEKDRPALDRVNTTMRALCKLSFDVVQGITNGTKHAGNSSGFRFVPGTDMAHPVLAYDVSGGYDVAGRYGGQPGLSVEIEGHKLFIDTAAQVVLQSFKAMYPDDLGSLDLSFCDEITVPSAASLANATAVRHPAVP